MKTRISIMHRAHRDGQAETIYSWRYGPRNLVTAYEALCDLKIMQFRYNTGGHFWLVTSNGPRKLDSLLADHDPSIPHSERVICLEAALLTAAEDKEMEAALAAA